MQDFTLQFTLFLLAIFFVQAGPTKSPQMAQICGRVSCIAYLYETLHHTQPAYNDNPLNVEKQEARKINIYGLLEAISIVLTGQSLKRFIDDLERMTRL
jgi:hypothetical protein